MAPEASVQLALLRAFEGAFREGLLLDQSLGAILDAALAYFDASSVALLPSGDGPATSRSTSKLESTTEDRLCLYLKTILKGGRPGQTVEGGLAFHGIPVKVNDLVHGAFGVVISAKETEPGPAEAVRLFGRTISHVLERERTLSTLLKRREEAAALYDLAAGVFHSLSAHEVIQLTVSSLSRELGFDRVKAYRYDNDTGEIEEILSEGDTRPGVSRRPIDSEGILVRCLAARGPVFDDSEESGGIHRERRQMALPIQADRSVFGFLVMSRRGSFVLTPQEMRLANELAKISAGALERSRLVDAERLNRDQLELAKDLRSTLAGLTEVGAVLARAAKMVGRHFALDACTLRLLPNGEQRGATASFVRAGLPPIVSGDEVPVALMERLRQEGSHVLVPDVSADSTAPSILPAPVWMKNLERPISLLAVPIAYQDAHFGVLAAVLGGNPRGFTTSTLRSFQALAAELSLAIGSALLFQREHASVRFLDRLQEIGKPLFSTFDAPRIKQILCDEALSLVGAASSHFWDIDLRQKRLAAQARAGERRDEAPRTVPFEHVGHPVARAFAERATMIGEELTVEQPVLEAGTRWAAVPVEFRDDQLGILSVERPRAGEPWDPSIGARLALLAEKGAIALHNARLMSMIEHQTERDSQSGLANRRAVLRRLESEVRRAERNGQSLAIANIRIEGLKPALRASNGSADGLLSKISARLTWSTRAMNLVGRDRSDCFWIVIFDANRAQAQQAISNIQRNFESSMNADPLPDAPIPMRITAGMACYPEDAFGADDLVQNAGHALKNASEAGLGNVVFYDQIKETAGPPRAGC